MVFDLDDIFHEQIFTVICECLRKTSTPDKNKEIPNSVLAATDLSFLMIACVLYSPQVNGGGFLLVHAISISVDGA